MNWEFLVALVVAIPVFLLPVALLWYVNASGIGAVLKDATSRRAPRRISHWFH